MTIQEGETQIEIAILPLEKLASRRGIASAAYCQAKQILSQYWNQIFEIQQNDTMFITEYVNLADFIFNSFVQNFPNFNQQMILFGMQEDN